MSSFIFDSAKNNEWKLFHDSVTLLRITQNNQRKHACPQQLIERIPFCITC